MAAPTDRAATLTPPAAPAPGREPAAPAAPGWRRLVRRAPLSLWLVLLLGLLALAGPSAAPDSPYQQRMTPDQVRQAPSAAHLVGTDHLGRDVFTRLLYGARVSLGVGVAAIVLAALAGVPLGMLAGYWLGWADNLIMRSMDALLAFPPLILAIALSLVVGTGIAGVILAIGVVSVPVFARLARASVLQVKSLEYTQAALATGASHGRVLARHILPNILGPLVVQASVSCAVAILVEAGLSFLGLGVQPPEPSWGTMINEGKQFMAQAPWLIFGPGLAIFLSVVAFNFLGDAARDALDPTSARTA